MKKTISLLSLKSSLVSCVILTVGMMIFSLTANAQTPTAPLNPYTQIAAKLDVTAYHLGTFERTHATDVLQNMLETLRPQLNGNNQSELSKFKMAYLKGVHSDVSQYGIAVEIALLTRLGDSYTNSATSGFQLTQNQIRQVYLEVIQQLQ